MEKDTPKYTAEEQAANPVPYSGVKTEINKNNDVLLADAKAANYSSFFFLLYNRKYLQIHLLRKEKN